MTVRTGIVGDYRDDFEPHSTTNDSSQSTFRAIFVSQTTAFVSYVLVNKIKIRTRRARNWKRLQRRNVREQLHT
jgi:hypothetical protein